MLDVFRQVLSWHRRHHPGHSALLELLEILMSTVAELDAKLDAITAGVNALKAEVAALKNQPPPVASQADLDALGAKEDAITAALNA